VRRRKGESPALSFIPYGCVLEKFSTKRQGKFCHGFSYNYSAGQVLENLFPLASERASIGKIIGRKKRLDLSMKLRAALHNVAADCGRNACTRYLEMMLVFFGVNYSCGSEKEKSRGE
jgi:hypothetical protein